MFSGMERGFRNLFCFKSALGRLEMLSPSSSVCVCVRICAGSDRGAYGRSHSPLTVPLFWQAQACFSQSTHSRSHSCTSLAPCLLAFSSLPGCKSFVVFQLIGHCFNYCLTEQTWNFYLSSYLLRDHGLQAGSTGLERFRPGVDCSSSHRVPIIYTFLGKKTFQGGKGSIKQLSSFFFAVPNTLLCSQWSQWETSLGFQGSRGAKSSSMA